MCALNFDPSPYLQLYQQRREAENKPPPWANASQNIMSGLDLLLREKRQRELMDMEREKLNFSRNQQLFENENKYGKDPTGIDIGVQGGIGQSSFMPGSLPRGVEGPQPAMKMGTNMPLVEALNKFRAGGLKASPENAQFMPYLGQEERKQYYENANQKLSLDSILAKKISDGEITLEQAIEMKKSSSPGTFMMGGVTGEGAPVFYNTKDPSNVQTGQVPGGGILYPKTPSQDQSNAGIYGQRAQEANKQLEDLINKGFDAASLETQGLSYFPNFLQPENVQAYEQLKRNFINATLRRESGATIRPEEMAEGNRQYFPQGGDKPETLKQKEQNRKTVIDSLSRIAGPMGSQVGGLMWNGRPLKDTPANREWLKSRGGGQ